MPSGTLGTAVLAANTNTEIYAVPGGYTASITIRLTNCGTTTAQVSVAIGKGTSPATKDYIEHGVDLRASGVLENTGLVLSAGDRVWAKSSTGSVAVRAQGYEEAIDG